MVAHTAEGREEKGRELERKAEFSFSPRLGTSLPLPLPLSIPSVRERVARGALSSN